MLGHKLWQIFSTRFETHVTVRHGFDAYAGYELFERQKTVENVAPDNFDSVVRAVAVTRPDVVVNCIGIVKQLPSASEALTSISVNALFPHRLAQLCHAGGTRLIHISTDCVFSGRKGNYVESDVSDAEDLYGRTKFLGEVSYDGSLTLRTSIIGRELETSHGLLEWFLAQSGRTVRGYRRAIFSGFTTEALGHIIAELITTHTDTEGVWHVASDPISKFDLLSLLNGAFRLNVQIEPDDAVMCDRSLDATRLREAIGFVPPTWPAMVEHLTEDKTPYDQFRGRRAQR